MDDTIVRLMSLDTNLGQGDKEEIENDLRTLLSVCRRVQQQSRGVFRLHVLAEKKKTFLDGVYDGQWTLVPLFSSTVTFHSETHIPLARKLSDVLLDFANLRANAVVPRKVTHSGAISRPLVTLEGSSQETNMTREDGSNVQRQQETHQLPVHTYVSPQGEQPSQPSLHRLQLSARSLSKVRQRLLPFKGQVDMVKAEYRSFLKFINDSRRNESEHEKQDGAGHRKKKPVLYERSSCTPQWFPKEFLLASEETIVTLSRPCLPLSFQITETQFTCIVAAYLDKEPDQTTKYLDKLSS